MGADIDGSPKRASMFDPRSFLLRHRKISILTVMQSGRHISCQGYYLTMRCGAVFSLEDFLRNVSEDIRAVWAMGEGDATEGENLT